MDLVKEFKSCEVGLRALFDIRSAKAHRAYVNSLLTGIDAKYPENPECDIPVSQLSARFGEINNLLSPVISNRLYLEDVKEASIEEQRELTLELIASSNRGAHLSVSPKSAGKHDIIRMGEGRQNANENDLIF